MFDNVLHFLCILTLGPFFADQVELTTPPPPPPPYILIFHVVTPLTQQYFFLTLPLKIPPLPINK